MIGVAMLLLLVAGIVAGRLAKRPDSPQALGPLSILAAGDRLAPIAACVGPNALPYQVGADIHGLDPIRRRSDCLLLDWGTAHRGASEYEELAFADALKLERQLGLKLRNLGPGELALGPQSLARLSDASGVVWLSANVSDSEGRPVGALRRSSKAGGRTIAVVGVLSPRLTPPPYHAADLVPAVKQALAENPLDYDQAVVLAYADSTEQDALRAALPASVIVVGPTAVVPKGFNPSGGSDPRPAESTVAAAPPSWVVFSMPENSRQWTSQTVVPVLSSGVPDPSHLQAFERKLAKRDLSPLQTPFVRPPELTTGFKAEVVGTQACRICHASECAAWDATRHARAWQSLVDRGMNFDPHCQRCHTTGYGWLNGFQSVARSAHATAVGCESCHGPGGAHVANPQVRTGLVAIQQCVTCHHPTVDPGFDVHLAWQKIAHGKSRPPASTGVPSASVPSTGVPSTAPNY